MTDEFPAGRINGCDHNETAYGGLEIGEGIGLGAVCRLGQQQSGADGQQRTPR